MQSKSITLSAYNVTTILDLAHDLHAEEALEDAAFVFNTQGHEDLKSDAAKSLLHFYACVQSLVRTLETNLKIE